MHKHLIPTNLYVVYSCIRTYTAKMAIFATLQYIEYI